MTTYIWKILEISAEDGIILHAKYHVTANDETNSVESEGNWWFSDKTEKKAFSDVTEADVISWIEKESIQDGISTIKLALDKQLDNLKTISVVQMPWNPQTFQIN